MKDLVCETCWTQVFNSDALEKFWLRQRDDFEYKSSWNDIVQNAGQGCNWCSFLKTVLPRPEEPTWPEEWTTDQELIISLGEASLSENTSPKGLNQCELDFGTGSSRRDWHAEIDLFTEPDNVAAHLITARPLQVDVGSAATYSQIRHWLDSCQTHEECPKALIGPLPTRVIEVTPLKCPETPRVMTTLGLRGPYVCLSYCWGPRQDYVLTTDSLQSFEQGIDISRLSRTVCDAITVAKGLGFRYLWVDALCIIQNSEWSKTCELAVMDRIYQESSLTIVAASAACASDGFLGARTAVKHEIFQIPCRLGQKQFASVSIQEHEQYDDLREPVNKRAWILQEQLLSPRLLIYASHTLQWQCRTLTCNMGDSYHAHLSSAPRLPFIDSVSKVESTLGGEARQKVIEDARQLTLQHWMRIIISYSNRSATSASDKLTALAGLASYFSPVLGPQYHAGTWGELFLEQLCWHSPSDTIFLSRPWPYRAPSWSWASVDGPLYFRTYRLNSYRPYRCELVQCKTTLKSESLKFGEVTDGYLVLRAAFREGLFHATRWQAITWQMTLQDNEHANDIVSEGGGYWDVARGFADTAEDNVDGPIVSLPLYPVEGMKVDKVGGLMLKGMQGGAFRRIGRFIADRSDFDHISGQELTII